MSEKYVLPSQKEIEESQGGSFVALKAGNYIGKLGKIRLLLRPTWNSITQSFDENHKDWTYKTIILPYAKESGDTMVDIEGNKVEPLTRWVWREINPFSIGFKLDKTPSFMRAIIAYCTGQDIGGNVVAEDFILFDCLSKKVDDEKIRKAFLAEQNTAFEERKLTGQGYKAIPDIISYEGKYIGCSVVVDAKGRNKITLLGELPSNFKADAEIEREKMPKFEESYEKMIIKEKENVSEVKIENEVADEVAIEDLSF